MSSKRSHSQVTGGSAGGSSGPARPPRPRESYHHGDLRAALLEAAHLIIGERGSAELSLREVARRAQVSHGAPAHHFRNKAGLLSAFAAQGFRRMAASIAEVEAERPPRNGPEKLAASGRGYLRFALANPAQFAIMFDTPALDVEDPDYVQASDQCFGLLTAAMAACVAEGRLSAVEAPLAVVTAWSMVHGFAALWIGGRMKVRSPARVRLADLGDRVIELLVKRLVGGRRDS
jgi:AcrR family transcriptional regulator